MRKPTLANVTGIVALSYLILIPTAGMFLWDRVRKLETVINDPGPIKTRKYQPRPEAPYTARAESHAD